MQVEIVDQVDGRMVVSVPTTRRLQWSVAVLCALILTLPLLMGQRTPHTLTLSHLVMVASTALVLLLAWASGELRRPTRPWWVLGILVTAVVCLQVLPVPWLAQWFGPYPAAMWAQTDAQPAIQPQTWSPNVGASLRAWSVFVALLSIAWFVAHLPRPLRMWLWLAIVISALFQAFYGLMAHAGGSTTVLGIWERNNVAFVHGSFSNRNVFSGYLALIWPLAIGVWFIRRVPMLHPLPTEIKIAGSLFCAGLIGTAMLGSASRLGAAAGVFGIVLTIALWQMRQRTNPHHRTWPAWLAAGSAMVAATWYGITPLAERLVATTGEEGRLVVWGQMLTEAPMAWWVHGVGLGGFEAAFKALQPGELSGKWYDYAHNDLLQWLFEMGLMGLVILVLVGATLWQRRRLDTESACLYAGLAAMAVVALGDFSWHIPATQVVIAAVLGALLKKPPRADKHATHKAFELDR